MKSKILSASLVALMSVGLMACSGSSGGGSPLAGGGSGGGTTPTPVDDKVTGIDIEGRWVSDCVLTFGGTGDVGTKFDITFQGRNFVRKTLIYTDTQCGQFNKEQTWTGTFHFDAALKNDIYTIRYTTATSTASGDNIKLDSQGLWISNLAYGEGMIPDVLLKKASEQNPTSPDDGSNTAIVLKSGDYDPQNGVIECAANVGVAKQNGVVIQLMINLGGCGSRTYTAECDGNICHSEVGNFDVKMTSATTFELKLLEDGATEVYKRR